MEVPTAQDAIFRFQAQSLSVPISQGGYSLGPTSVYHTVAAPPPTYNVLTTGVPGTMGLSAAPAAPNLIDAGGLLIRSINSQGPLGSPGFNAHGVPLLGSEGSLGLVTAPNGALYQMNVSPLLGVRVEPLLPRTPGEELNLLAPEQLNPETLQPGQSTGVSPAMRGRAAAPFSAGLELGAQLSGMVAAPRLGAGPMLTLDERVKQIQASLFSPLGSRVTKPGEDVYLDLLTQIRAQQDLAEGKTPKPGTVEASLPTRCRRCRSRPICPRPVPRPPPFTSPRRP